MEVSYRMLVKNFLSGVLFDSHQAVGKWQQSIFSLSDTNSLPEI